MAKSIVVYTAPACPFCVQAKALLGRRGLAFEEKMISYEDEEAWAELDKKSGGMKTVPQIYVDGQIVGGYQELLELDHRDQLKSLT